MGPIIDLFIDLFSDDPDKNLTKEQRMVRNARTEQELIHAATLITADREAMCKLWMEQETDIVKKAKMKSRIDHGVYDFRDLMA